MRHHPLEAHGASILVVGANPQLMSSTGLCLVVMSSVLRHRVDKEGHKCTREPVSLWRRTCGVSCSHEKRNQRRRRKSQMKTKRRKMMIFLVEQRHPVALRLPVVMPAQCRPTTGKVSRRLLLVRWTCERSAVATTQKSPVLLDPPTPSCQSAKFAPRGSSAVTGYMTSSKHKQLNEQACLFSAPMTIHASARSLATSTLLLMSTR